VLFAVALVPRAVLLTRARHPVFPVRGPWFPDRVPDWAGLPILTTLGTLSLIAGAGAAVMIAAAALRWLSVPGRPPNRGMDAFLDPLRPRFAMGPWLAAAALAVLPASAVFDGNGHPEGLFVFLLSLWLYLAGRYRAGSGAGLLFLAGVTLGLAAALRPLAWILLPWHLALPLLGRRFPEPGPWVLAVAAPVLGFVAAFVPAAAGGFPLPVFQIPRPGDVYLPDAGLTALRFLWGDPEHGLALFLGPLAVLGTVTLVLRGGRAEAWLVTLTWGVAAACLLLSPEHIDAGYFAAVPALLLAAGAGADTLLRPLVGRVGTPPWGLIAITVVLALTPQLVTLGRLLAR